MLYERRSVNGGKVLICTIDDEAEELHVECDEQSKLIVRFDELVEEKIKIALARSFADQGYKAPDTLLSALGFINPVPRTDVPLVEFTVDDSMFVKALQNYGLSLEIAAHCAFYSKDFAGVAPNFDRHAVLDHYMGQLHAVRMENKDWLRGFTSLELYMMIAQRSSLRVADSITRKAYSIPSSMAKDIDTLSALIQSKVRTETLTDKQLGALSAVVSSNFPVARSDGKREILVNTITEFLGREHDFKQAARNLRRRSEFKEQLSNELMRYIDYWNPNHYGEQDYGNRHTEALASIFITTYGQEFMEKALKGFHSHERLLDLASPYTLAAFIAYVSHLELGGDPEDPIHWIITLDPSIEDASIIQRGSDDDYEDD